MKYSAMVGMIFGRGLDKSEVSRWFVIRVMGWTEWDQSPKGDSFTLVLSLYGLGWNIDSYIWVENLSSTTSYRPLFVDKHSWFSSGGMILCCTCAFNLMGNEGVQNMHCYFHCYFVLAYEFCNLLLLEVKFDITVDLWGKVTL